MRRGVSYPEDRGHKGCQLAFDFGYKRGREVAYGEYVERLNPLPFDTPERMAYYRGYARGRTGVHRPRV